MLVEMQTSATPVTRACEIIAADAAAKYGASVGSLKGSKDILQCPQVKRVKRVVSDFRSLYYKLTLPWGRDGERILPTRLFLQFTDAYVKAQIVFKDSLDDLVSDLPSIIATKRTELGQLFDAGDYPSVNQLRRSFVFKVPDPVPIPNAGDWRLDLSQTKVDELKLAYERRLGETLKNASAEAYARLIDVCDKAGERLSDDRNIFRDSLIENIRDLVNVIDSLNLADDPDLTAQAAKIRQSIATMSPQTLRESKVERAAAAAVAKDAASELRSSLAGLMKKDDS